MVGRINAYVYERLRLQGLEGGRGEGFSMEDVEMLLVSLRGVNGRF